MEERIKQVKTKQGWLYLAIVLDIGSRRVIGWSMSDSATEQLVSKAFEMAYKQRQPQVGWIYHSDRGSQYTSTAHQEQLRACGARVSLSRVGKCGKTMDKGYGRNINGRDKAPDGAIHRVVQRSKTTLNIGLHQPQAV